MKNARFKRSKMRQLPGDLSLRKKIRMMESNKPIEIFPWQTIEPNAIKTFRRWQKQRAKVKFRCQQRKDIEEEC